MRVDEASHDHFYMPVHDAIVSRYRIPLTVSVKLPVTPET